MIFGTGFDRTFTICAKAGVEYKYREDDFGFTFVFARNLLSTNDKKNGRITVKENPLDHEIIEAVKDNKYITIPEFSLLTGKSEVTIHRHLDALSKSGMIRRVGSRKTGYWDLL